MKTTILLLMMMLAMVSCSKQPSKSDAAMDSTPALKISVLKDGAILADGKTATIPELDKALEQVKK